MGTGNGFAADKRRYPRVAGDQLPAALRTLTVAFGDDAAVHPVRTIDASVSGISFRIDLPVYSIKDYNLVITSSDGGLTLRDELVYAKPLDLESSRVSVHFTSQPGLERYAELFKQGGAHPPAPGQ
jgi:hypothetical protein